MIPNPSAKKLVLMAGNIGSGKTSLTRLLGKRLKWETAYESVVDNPYLPAFYEDMKAWAFPLQIYFLGSRAEQHERLAGSTHNAAIDRSIYEDAHIFARALHEMGNLNDTDYETYLKLYRLVIAKLPKPDLLVYLRTPISELIHRIQIRARRMETGISAEYLTLLQKFYEEWIQSFDLCPLLTIENGNLDFVHEEEAGIKIIDMINRQLSQ